MKQEIIQLERYNQSGPDPLVEPDIKLRAPKGVSSFHKRGSYKSVIPTGELRVSSIGELPRGIK